MGSVFLNCSVASIFVWHLVKPLIQRIHCLPFHFGMLDVLIFSTCYLVFIHLLRKYHVPGTVLGRSQGKWYFLGLTFKEALNLLLLINNVDLEIRLRVNYNKVPIFFWFPIFWRASVVQHFGRDHRDDFWDARINLNSYPKMYWWILLSKIQNPFLFCHPSFASILSLVCKHPQASLT